MRHMDARYAAKPVRPRPSLWRQRTFVVLWTGQTISLGGSAVTTIALPLGAIAGLNASAFQVGLLTAATYAAFALISLPAGVVVDRVRKRPIMIWSDILRLVII